MRIKDVMMGTPYYCGLGTNLGSAVELMWNGNCGFLPVVDTEGRVTGVITDRDICIALATRGFPAGEVKVEDVITRNLFSCRPDDDVHTALQTMREAKVRRLPVIAPDGGLVGIVSMDDLVMHAQPRGAGREPELTCDEVVKTYQAVMQSRERQSPSSVLSARQGNLACRLSQMIQHLIEHLHEFAGLQRGGSGASLPMEHGRKPPATVLDSMRAV